MRDVVRADRPHAAGWLNTWHAVDESGHVGLAIADGSRPVSDLYSDLTEVMATVAELTAPDLLPPDAIGVDALLTPALQRLLDVAARVARDGGAAAVDVAHVEIALDRRRTEKDG
ncbi:hypothetical protein [Nocardia sp. NPDC051833]|uniref:hypothetical protein n=1 Tax=Nocardia sp. NPDC051833 TaxID=3155674 RepID=UPI0034126463